MLFFLQCGYLEQIVLASRVNALLLLLLLLWRRERLVGAFIVECIVDVGIASALHGHGRLGGGVAAAALRFLALFGLGAPEWIREVALWRRRDYDVFWIGDCAQIRIGEPIYSRVVYVVWRAQVIVL